MAITKKPFSIQPAFNELIFEDNANTTLTVSGVSPAPSTPVKLYRVRFNGVSRFDVQGIVSRLFTDLRVSVAPIASAGLGTWAFEDFNLKVPYTVSTEKFIALNAVRQIGESLDLYRTGMSSVLTHHRIEGDYHSMPVYKGFPVGASIMAKSRYINRQYVEAHTIDGRVERIELSESGLNHVHVEFTPQGGNDDMDRISLTGSSAAVDNIDVHFTLTCTPERPFYVRWINDDGGYNYRMMEARHWFTRSASDVNTFSPFLANTPDARGTSTTVSLSAKESISVGVDMVSYEDALIISRLVFSPKIEWYDTDMSMWKRITLEGSNSIEIDSDRRFFTLEFKFLLPTPRIQF